MRPSTDSERPAGRLSRLELGVCLLISIAVFFLYQGPIWRHRWRIDGAIGYSYLVIPFVVAGVLLRARKFEVREFALGSLEVACWKFGITYLLANTMWMFSTPPPHVAAPVVPASAAILGRTPLRVPVSGSDGLALGFGHQRIGATGRGGNRVRRRRPRGIRMAAAGLGSFFFGEGRFDRSAARCGGASRRGSSAFERRDASYVDRQSGRLRSVQSPPAKLRSLELGRASPGSRSGEPSLRRARTIQRSCAAHRRRAPISHAARRTRAFRVVGACPRVRSQWSPSGPMGGAPGRSGWCPRKKTVTVDLILPATP